MRGFMRFLRPMAFLRRKAIYAGLLGGNRKWLAWGGLAWGLHWLGGLFGTGDPVPRLTEELRPGETMIIHHEAQSPLAQRKAARRARRAARRGR